MLLNYKVSGDGAPVVFLHGMAASNRYWDQVVQVLPPEYQAITMDLLGFGRSPKPLNVTYDYETHISSVLETLDHIGIDKPFILVGHSMGALLALRLAAENPNRVSRLVLCGLPFYPTRAIAKHAITSSKKRLELAYYGPSSRLLCNIWCKWLRPITRHIAPLYLTHQPKLVAQDSLLHTWQSYDQSRHHVIESQNVPHDLKNLQIPAIFVYGSTDNGLLYVTKNDLLKKSAAKLKVLEGFSHNLPVEQPHYLTKLL